MIIVWSIALSGYKLFDAQGLVRSVDLRIR